MGERDLKNGNSINENKCYLLATRCHLWVVCPLDCWCCWCCCFNKHRFRCCISVMNVIIVVLIITFRFSVVVSSSAVHIGWCYALIVWTKLFICECILALCFQSIFTTVKNKLLILLLLLVLFFPAELAELLESENLFYNFI